MSGLIFILIILTGIVVLIDFITFLFSGERLFNKVISLLIEVFVIIVYTIVYLNFFDYGMSNDCCTDSATFSPDHRLTIYTLISLCSMAFFFSRIRKNIAPPVPEIIINSFLIIGIVLNIFIAIQIGNILWLLGNLPIIMLFIMAVAENQKKLMAYIKESDTNNKNKIEKVCWYILKLKLLYKIPLVFILSLPLLLIILCILLIFGQKPDSIISAFTDTYKHGLSQLDYMCDNVNCGEHFLCSVAANGHKTIVKPVRLGIRNNKLILCNRQLLIANAFEELLEQKMPIIHKYIRKKYNLIGHQIHKHYGLFTNKLFADIIYTLMKPLELLFLIILYSLCKNPENRISSQYLSLSDKLQIEKINKLAQSEL